MKKKRNLEIGSQLNETLGYASLEYPPDEDIYRRNDSLLLIGEGCDANMPMSTRKPSDQ